MHSNQLRDDPFTDDGHLLAPDHPFRKLSGLRVTSVRVFHPSAPVKGERQAAKERAQCLSIGCSGLRDRSRGVRDACFCNPFPCNTMRDGAMGTPPSPITQAQFKETELNFRVQSKENQR